MKKQPLSDRDQGRRAIEAEYVVSSDVDLCGINMVRAHSCQTLCAGGSHSPLALFL